MFLKPDKKTMQTRLHDALTEIQSSHTEQQLHVQNKAWD